MLCGAENFEQGVAVGLLLLRFAKTFPIHLQGPSAHAALPADACGASGQHVELCGLLEEYSRVVAAWRQSGGVCRYRFRIRHFGNTSAVWQTAGSAHSTATGKLDGLLLGRSTLVSFRPSAFNRVNRRSKTRRSPKLQPIRTRGIEAVIDSYDVTGPA